MIFSIGFNGYDRLWKRCVDSHRRYAERLGDRYLIYGAGVTTPLSMESAWLKIPLIIAALDAGHPWVLFLDADTTVADDAPRFESVVECDKDVYLANGFSGRPNSGVMAVKNTPRARQLFVDILRSAGMPLPRRDRVGWGENGEVIHHLRSYPGFALLDRKWNNNTDVDLKDYIRHFSTGVMRDTYDYGEGAQDVATVIKSTNTTVVNRPGGPEFFQGMADLLADADPADFSAGPILQEIVASGDDAARGSAALRKIKWRVSRLFK
jgi:hypothetical protein